MPHFRNFQLPGRSAVYSNNAMAATSQPLATNTALDILRAGGNALDAAIAACAVQCVVEPQSTGIGGDCFCLYAPAGSEKVIAYNGSGRAPAALTIDYLAGKNLKLERTSPHAVIVPGAVDAWHALNRDHGQLPLKDLLQPAIGFARDGFPIAPRVARDMAGQSELFQSNKNLAAIFAPTGVPGKSGEMLVQSALGRTLEQIAAHGRDAFYQGEIAEDIVATLGELGGGHTLDDFANAQGEYVDPISTTFRGHEVFECPPNGQGIIALLLLNMMELGSPSGEVLSLERIHHELEACRLAYQARTRYVADPAKYDVPIEELLSIDYAEQLVRQVDPNVASTSGGQVDIAAASGAAHKDTVTLSVVDAQGNACSFINTLFWPFGSGITTQKTGIVLTNRGEGFVLDPNAANCLAPNKRPLHTIIPGLVKKGGQTVMPFGVMGGEYQAMGHMQFLTRMLDFDCDVQQAQDLPRFMVCPFTGEVEVEDGIDGPTREGLAKLGHKVVSAPNPIGGSQAIHITRHPDGSTVLGGGSDPRKDGCALGY